MDLHAGMVLGLALLAFASSLTASPSGSAGTPAPDGFDCYISAGKLLSDQHDYLSSFDELTTEQKKSLLEENSAALSKLREGLKLDASVPSDLALATDSVMPMLPFRNLARMLKLEASVKKENGDFPGAMDSLLDAVRFGADCSRGGNMIQSLVGLAVAAIGRVPAPELVEKLDGPQARAAAKKAATAAARFAPPAYILRVEQEWGRRMLAEDLAAPDWRAKVAGVSAVLEGDKPDKKLVAWLKTKSKEEVRDSYEQFVAETIRREEMPYPEAVKLPPIPLNPYLEYIVTSISHAYRVRYAEFGLLPAALAVRAFKCEHGDYPASLEELVPGYLSAIPPDPFGNNQPLRYKKTKDGCVIYSIGPDCKDDGGKPIKLAKNVRTPSPRSKGDIVYEGKI